MSDVLFYHLTRRSLEETLCELLPRALSRGWRVAVRGRERARLEWLDERLWLGDESGFLPHGLSGGPHDALQPVLLTDGASANRPDCLMCIDGAEVDPRETGDLSRVCILFDGNETAAVVRARDQWRTVTGAGLRAEYWSEESGRWERKAESGG